jgi:hypothetical protein
MIRKIGTGDSGEPVVLAELNATEKLALANILTLARVGGEASETFMRSRDGKDADRMIDVIRDVFGIEGGR